MITITHPIVSSFSYPLSDSHSKETVLYLDIETTGLSPKSSFLYMVGCIYFAENNWKLIQWFNDDGDSEERLLKEVCDFILNYNLLIHYNGNRFDIPYLIERCKKYNIPNVFSEKNQLDLYKTVRRYQNILKLTSLSQHDVETVFHMNRKEFHSGGDLIEPYYIYLKTRDEETKHQLLTHNYDDLVGLFTISQLCCFDKLLNGEFCVDAYSSEDESLHVALSYDGQLPHLTISNGYCTIIITEHKVQLNIPIINGKIRNYYTNYNDYCYLPAEDMAIHKTLSAYVSKEAKIKATPETCYSWVTYQEDLFHKNELKSYIQSLLNCII